MNAAMDRMEAQLRLWLVKVDRQVDRSLAPGHRAGFDELMQVDVLKALYVIAQAKCAECRAAGAADQPRIMDELTSIASELEVALKTSRASRYCR